MTTPFKPAWWLPGPHLQTLWPTLSRRGKKYLKLNRERIELSDGDFIDLDWTDQKTGPIVLLLHGLEGTKESPYVKGMMRALTEKGWRSVLMSFRGCSGEPNRLERLYHCGETQDLRNILKILKCREPNEKIAAIGFSVGGNVLLKHLGEQGDKTLLTTAVAVSVPFELGKSVDRLRQGFSKIYEKYLLRAMHRKIKTKFAHRAWPDYFPPLKKLNTIRSFDDKIIGPLHDFLNADDYYQQSSSRQFLGKIKIPTYLIQAADDPFMTPDLIPASDELSPHVTLELTTHGGHVGFVAGTVPWRARYWLEERIPLLLEPHIQ